MNELIRGDNLETMRVMESKSVDLIYLDPPFMTGRDWGAFDDRWSDGKILNSKFLEAVQTTHSKGMVIYLGFMALRLIEMKRLLKDTGSIYLHCDSTSSHYLKVVMDGVFGFKKFQNEIIWRRANAHNDSKKYANITDSILFYRIDELSTWNPYYRPLDDSTVAKWYVNDDNDGRGAYNRLSLSAPRSGLKTWRGITLTKRSWNAPRKGKIADVIEKEYISEYKSIVSCEDRLEALDSVGLVHWPKKSGGIPSLKQYRSMTVGLSPSNLFDDLPLMRDLPKEYTGYPTQKPLVLLERIIMASSNEGDTVLDPFSGSGTALVAAKKLGREYVGIDISEDAVNIAKKRLEEQV